MIQFSRVFKKNLKYIEDFNSKGNQNYTLGVNQFTDLTSEEFFATHTGLIKGINITSPGVIPSPKRNFSDIDHDSYFRQDWRKRGAVTHVRYQGGCGGCWAFATIAAVEGVMKITQDKLVPLSEQQLIDCDRSVNNGCIGGNVERAYDFIAKNGGIASEDEYPYLFQEGPGCQTKARPSMQIRGFEYVRQNDEDALRQAVWRQPISVTIFGDIDSLIHYKGGVYDDPECGNEETHAVTLVGYGTSPKGIKYWLAKNSWGKWWGEDGYIRFRRDVEWTQGVCGLAQWPSYPIASD